MKPKKLSIFHFLLLVSSNIQTTFSLHHNFFYILTLLIKTRLFCLRTGILLPTEVPARIRAIYSLISPSSDPCREDSNLIINMTPQRPPIAPRSKGGNQQIELLWVNKSSRISWLYDLFVKFGLGIQIQSDVSYLCSVSSRLLLYPPRPRFRISSWSPPLSL